MGLCNSGTPLVTTVMPQLPLVSSTNPFSFRPYFFVQGEYFVEQTHRNGKQNTEMGERRCYLEYIFYFLWIDCLLGMSLVQCWNGIGEWRRGENSMEDYWKCYVVLWVIFCVGEDWDVYRVVMLVIGWSTENENGWRWWHYFLCMSGDK